MKKTKWNGMCPAGKHGLDFEGQPCDLCPKKRQTIKSLAKEIQERFPKLRVTVQRWESSTDQQIGRLLWPGKGRTGDRITVTDTDGRVLLDHKNSETYRRTSEVRDWLNACIRAGKPISKWDMYR